MPPAWMSFWPLPVLPETMATQGPITPRNSSEYESRMAGENRVRWRHRNEGPKGPIFRGFIHLDPQTMCEVPLHLLQTSSDGTLCPNICAQLCRMRWGQREGQSHHRAELLREEYIPQTGRSILHTGPLASSPSSQPTPVCQPRFLQLFCFVLTLPDVKRP